MKWGNKRKSGDLMIQGQYWLDWLFGLRKRGSRLRFRLTCRMIAGLLLAVMLAVGSFVLAPVSVVQGATIVSSVLPITKIKSVTTQGVYHFDWTDGQTFNASYRISTGSMTVDGVAATWVGVCMKVSGTDKVIGLGGEGPWTAFTNGAYHVVSWTAGTLVPNDFDGVNLYTWPAGSQSMKLPPTTNGLWVTTNVYTPVAVSVTGAASVAIGSTSSYTATIANGLAPFTGHWTLTGLQTSLGPTVAVVGTTSVMPWTFGTVKGMQNIRYDVTDSVGQTAFALIDVKVGEYAPALRGQLYFTGSELRFALYPQASNPVGEYVEPGTENVMNTDDYTIDRVLLGLEWAYYRLADVAPLANPYVVHVSYVDPTNGRVYPYTFSFDTTLMVGGGDWGQGDGSHGSGELPSWAQAFMDIAKDGLKALFVPNDAQMQLLLPSGTLGASLLEGTTWGTGSSTWNMHVHWGASEITLVSMNFATVADYGFVRAIRYAIQAGVSLGLVYLIVVLI